MDPLSLKDPVCGESLDPSVVRRASVFKGREFFFCSDACQEKFLGHPEAFIPAL